MLCINKPSNRIMQASLCLVPSRYAKQHKQNGNRWQLKPTSLCGSAEVLASYIALQRTVLITVKVAYACDKHCPYLQTQSVLDICNTGAGWVSLRVLRVVGGPTVIDSHAMELNLHGTSTTHVDELLQCCNDASCRNGTHESTTRQRQHITVP